MKKKVKFSITILFVLLINITTNAQVLSGQDASQIVKEAKEIHINSNSSIPEFIIFESDKAPAFEGFEQWLRITFRLNSSFGLKLINTETDKIGFIHYRYAQTFNNYPVSGSMMLVHVKNNMVQSVNGNFIDDVKTNAIVLTENDALNKAMAYVGAKQYKWQIPAEEEFIKREQNDPNATFFPKGELMYASDENGNFKNSKLTYRFDIYTHQPHSRQYIYVNATTGEIVTTEDRIQHTNATGSATTAYSGVQTIITDFTGTTYRLREAGRGAGLGMETYDMRLAGTSYAAAVDFTDADNVWNNVNVNKDQYAPDAHFGTEKTYDYFYNTYNRNSINNAGFKLLSYVHTNLVAFGYGNNVNAFWDGSRMTYGDGNASYTPLTAMDIAGHEITHGLTSNTAGLVYRFESGALNEAFSDIFGTTIEYYATPSLGDWLIGEDIGSAFRNMQNPNAKNHPDTYHGTFWNFTTSDNGGVHTNSGVLNYWYYLLCQGGSGTNDIGNAFTVSAIGMTKAGAIAYRTLTTYLTSSSNFANCRTLSLQAATDLYGACSAEVSAVAAAWYAVGVGTLTPAITPVITPAGATSICLGQNILLSGQSISGSNFQWKLDGNNISGATSNTYSASLAGNYQLVATNSCSVVTTSNTIAITTSTIAASISPSSSVLNCTGGPVLLTATTTAGYPIQWNKDGVPISGATSSTYSATTSGSYTVSLSGTANALQTISNTSAALSIPDNSCTGASKTIAVSGYTGNVNTSGITIKINITHTYDSDIKFVLTAPNGDILGLSNGAGGSGDNFVNTIFSDAGATNISAGTAPFTGTYKPNASLFSACTNVYTTKTTFAGIGNGSINPNGNWVLKVLDLGATDVGTIGSWEITFPAYTTPFPYCGPLTSAATNVVIANPAAPTISAGGTTTFCSGGNVVLTSSASSGNTWSTSATTQAITVNATGNYSVTYTDVNGCAVTSSATSVTVNPLPSAPTISAGGPTTFCAGNSVVLTSNQSTGNSWSNGANTQSTAITLTGNYTVTFTNGNGCSATSSATSVTVNPTVTPTIGITNSQVSVCSGMVFNSSITNGGTTPTYQWKKNGSNISGQTSNSYTGSALQAGDIITCQLTSNATCAVSPVTSNAITVSFSPPTTTWLGVTNNWFTSGNWSNGLPTSNKSAIIPMGTAFNPNIIAAGAVCYHLTVNMGAGLTISGSNSIDVYGNFTNNGTFTYNTSNVKLLGCAGTRNELHDITTSNGNKTTFYNLTLNDQWGSILNTEATMIGSLTLTNGTFTNNNKQFTFRSTSGATARIAPVISPANYVGNIRMERFAPGGKTGWAQLGTCIQGATLASWYDNFIMSGFIGVLNNPTLNGFKSVYTYNETIAGAFDATGSFVAATNVTNAVPVGKGFWVYLGNGSTTTAAITFDVTGQPKIGTHEFNPTFTNSSNAGDGYNLVANPYPSTIDWLDTAWTKVNMNNATYIYQADNSQYASFVNGIGTNGGSRYIASSQGFFVQANSANPRLRIGEYAKNIANPTFIKESDPTNLLRLTINGYDMKDETAIHLNSEATKDFDGDYDAMKFFSDYTPNPSIASIVNGKDLSINSIPFEAKTISIPVRVAVGIAGTYTLSWSGLDKFPEGSCIVLEDLDNGNKMDLTGNQVYYFNAEIGFKDARFLIHISTPLERTASEASCSNTQDGSITLHNPFNSICKVILSKDKGEELKNVTFSDATYTFNNLPAGTYKVSYPDATSCGNMEQTIEIAASNNVAANFEPSATTVFANEKVSFKTVFAKGNNLTWDFGDGYTTTGESNVEHKYANEGIYTVTLTNTKGDCGDNQSMTLNVSNANSLNNSMDVQMINGSFYAVFNFDKVSIANITIVNLLGQQVATSKTYEGKAGNIKLDLSNSVRGIYLVTLTNGSDMVAKRIVK